VQSAPGGKSPSNGPGFGRGELLECHRKSSIIQLISIVTGSAAIAAGGIGHVVAARAAGPCALGGCVFVAHQVKPAHVAKASAWIALHRH
jgi:hypothetical protein